MPDWSGLLSLLALGYAAFLALCAWHIARRLRYPPRRTYAWAVSRGLPGEPAELRPPLNFEDSAFEWQGVAIPVWDVPGADPRAPVVVLTPGWGDSRVGGLVRLAAIAPHASRIILWDPPGLGASERPAAPGHHALPWSMSTRDHLALLALVEARTNDAPAGVPLVLFGWSAGAGASILAAAQLVSSARPRRPIAVIAEAPYRLPWTPARNVIRAAGLPWFLCGPLAFAALGLRLGVGPRWRNFDRAAHAAALAGKAPTLVIHGEADEVCPLDDGRAIAAAADAAFLPIPAGRHNDLWVEPSLARAASAGVAAFLSRLASAR